MSLFGKRRHRDIEGLAVQQKMLHDCSMGKGDARSVRKSVAVTPLLQRVLAHPAEYGLERNVSESKALQVLAERGARFSAETQRHDAELRAYAAYAQDEERLAVASDIQRAALESGAM